MTGTALKEMKRFINRFSIFLEENYPYVFFAKDIPAEAVQEYIDKNKFQWTKQNLKKYRNRFFLLMKIINKAYNASVDFSDVVYFGSDPHFTPMINDESFIQLRESFREGNPRFKWLIDIISTTGLNLNEILSLTLNNVDLEKNCIKVKSSLDVERTIPLYDERLEIWKDIVNDCIENGREKIVDAKPPYTFRFFRQHCEKYVEATSYENTAFHLQKIYVKSRCLEEAGRVRNINKAWAKVEKEIGNFKRDQKRELRKIFGQVRKQYDKEHGLSTSEILYD